MTKKFGLFSLKDDGYNLANKFKKQLKCSQCSPAKPRQVVNKLNISIPSRVIARNIQRQLGEVLTSFFKTFWLN